MNEIILAPCDAGYVQSCTGFFLIEKVEKFKKTHALERVPLPAV
jgi:hypothetical protein